MGPLRRLCERSWRLAEGFRDYLAGLPERCQLIHPWMIVQALRTKCISNLILTHGDDSCLHYSSTSRPSDAFPWFVMLWLPLEAFRNGKLLRRMG